METIRLFLFAVVAISLALLGSHTISSSRAQAVPGGEQPPAITQWEYVSVSEITGRNQYSSLHSAGKNSIQVSLAKVFEEVGGDTGDKKFNSNMLLNMLGKQGWELVSHTESPTQSDLITDTWIFKRPVR